MKTQLQTSLILIALTLILPCTDLKAQEAYQETHPNTYQEAMTQSLAAMETANSPAEHQANAQRFERIALAKNDRWLPWYYMSMNMILASLEESDPQLKEALLVSAWEGIVRARELAPEESEIHVLEAFYYPSYILVDPMARGMSGMEKMGLSLETARKLDPDNPRIYYLEGVQKLNLPEAFGGGPQIARLLLETAVEKFENEASRSAFWPKWGEEDTRAQLEKIRNLAAKY